VPLVYRNPLSGRAVTPRAMLPDFHTGRSFACSRTLPLPHIDRRPNAIINASCRVALPRATTTVAKRTSSPSRQRISGKLPPAPPCSEGAEFAAPEAVMYRCARDRAEALLTLAKASQHLDGTISTNIAHVGLSPVPRARLQVNHSPAPPLAKLANTVDGHCRGRFHASRSEMQRRQAKPVCTLAPFSHVLYQIHGPAVGHAAPMPNIQTAAFQPTSPLPARPISTAERDREHMSSAAALSSAARHGRRNTGNGHRSLKGPTHGNSNSAGRPGSRSPGFGAFSSPNLILASTELFNIVSIPTSPPPPPF
jgi:hypothetical protein